MKEKKFSIAVLDRLRSVKKTLLSESELSPTNLASGGTKYVSPSGLPLSPLGTGGALGDDYGSSICNLPIKWCVCFVILSLSVVMVLGFHTVSDDWRALAFRCSVKTPSSAISDSGASSSTRDRQFGDEYDEELQFAEEDELCLSRTRHLLYRRPESLYPQPSRLTQALQDYSSLHARCSAGKNWQDFTGTTADFDQESSCKYLFYLEGVEGLGNRILSVISAFTYALATDRVLLLDSRLNLGDLLCEPFPNSSWILPPNFPYQRISEFPTLDSLGAEGIKGNEVVALRLNLRHEQSPQDQTFFCGDTQEQLVKLRWIAWKSNQYYVTRLFMIPALWARLSPLFDDPSRVFTQLSRHFILPKNPIWAKTLRVYRGYLQKAAKLVGLQVRAPHSPDYSQVVQDRIKQCLFGDHILPKVTETKPQQSLPWTLPKKFRLGKASDLAIFVASLQRGYYERWREIYMEQDTEDGTFVSVHTVESDGVENQSFEQVVEALIDMWLLSYSDTLVTSAWSTFGYVAQGLGAVYPYIINTDERQSENHCVSGQSVEPCTHFPFITPCSSGKNVTVEHEEWIKKHLRACQDEPTGLQLVS